MDVTISLRQFINEQESYNSLGIKSFCRLMKKVENAIDLKEGDLIKINLDQILINKENGEIVLPDNLFAKNPDLEKTITSFDTGISILAERKSTMENKRVSFALMMLGWYCNEDGNSVNSDMDALENFDEYIEKVPLWMQEYFVEIFKHMNYEYTFSDFYDKNFTEKVVSDIKSSFKGYNLREDQLNRIVSLIIKETNKKVKEGKSYE
jgi:hypothetical protein